MARRDGSAAPKPPPVPPARDFIKAVREYLGDGVPVSQNFLADWIAADRSMVGRWEMEKGGGDPSWPYIGRILILLHVLDPTGKLLRVPDALGQSRAMGIEERVLAALRQLTEDEKLDILQDVTRRAHAVAANQHPAAQKKG